MSNNPDRGRPVYARSAARLLSNTAHVWGVDRLNHFTADSWGANITFLSDDVAATVARHLGIPDEVVRETVIDKTLVRSRVGTIGGIALTISSHEPAPDGEVAP